MQSLVRCRDAFQRFSCKLNAWGGPSSRGSVRTARQKQLWENHTGKCSRRKCTRELAHGNLSLTKAWEPIAGTYNLQENWNCQVLSHGEWGCYSICKVNRLHTTSASPNCHTLSHSQLNTAKQQIGSLQAALKWISFLVWEKVAH